MRYILKTRAYIVVTDDYSPKEYNKLLENLRSDLRALKLKYGTLYDIDGKYLQTVTA